MAKKVIDKLVWLPIRNRKVLFARSRGQKIFYCVGGKREPGESDEQALLRETLEETGVTLEPATITYINTFKGPSVTGPDDKLILIATGSRSPSAS